MKRIKVSITIRVSLESLVEAHAKDREKAEILIFKGM